MPRPTNVQNANAVRVREVANDKFYTPASLVDLHLSKFHNKFHGLTIYEPFAGQGTYLSRFPDYFPDCKFESTEIDNGTDFFDYTGTPDVVITNPPFSILKQVFERLYALNPLVISLVLNQHAITPCRIQNANAHGYFVTDYHLTRCDRWFGVACILTLRRDVSTNVISFDTIKHKLEA